jgi:hypothetical protein
VPDPTPRFFSPEDLPQPSGYSQVVRFPAGDLVWTYTRRPPTSTLVEVSGLVRPELLIEIEAFASVAS